MTSLPFNFQPAAVPAPERGDFDLIPNGTTAVMQATEADVLEKDYGHLLKVTFDILDGPFTNRKIWTNWCIVHTNPTTQMIAQQQLASFCEAIGVAGTSDTDDLTFKPFIGRVGVEKDKSGQYGDKNKVAKFLPLEGAVAPAQPQARPQPQAQARPAASNGTGPRVQGAAPPAGSPARPWGNRAA